MVDLALLQSLGGALACGALQMCQMRVGREILKNVKGRLFHFLLSSVLIAKHSQLVCLSALLIWSVCRVYLSHLLAVSSFFALVVTFVYPKPVSQCIPIGMLCEISFGYFLIKSVFRFPGALVFGITPFQKCLFGFPLKIYFKINADPLSSKLIL